ncbi:MAG: hypothetical protein ACRD3W_30820 [Terriglobales bacterium]
MAVPPLRPLFVPDGPGRQTVDHPGVGHPALLPAYKSGDGWVSQVPGDPSCALALFSDPGGTEYARPLRRIGVVPASDKRKDSREKLSGLNRTAWALAVYASQ